MERTVDVIKGDMEEVRTAIKAAQHLLIALMKEMQDVCVHEFSLLLGGEGYVNYCRKCQKWEEH